MSARERTCYALAGFVILYALALVALGGVQ